MNKYQNRSDSTKLRLKLKPAFNLVKYDLENKQARLRLGKQKLKARTGLRL